MKMKHLGVATLLTLSAVSLTTVGCGKNDNASSNSPYNGSNSGATSVTAPPSNPAPMTTNSVTDSESTKSVSGTVTPSPGNPTSGTNNDASGSESSKSVSNSANTATAPKTGSSSTSGSSSASSKSTSNP